MIYRRLKHGFRLYWLKKFGLLWFEFLKHVQWVCFPYGEEFYKVSLQRWWYGCIFPPERGVYVLKASVEMSFYKKFSLWRRGIGILKKRNVSKKIIASIWWVFRRTTVFNSIWKWLMWYVTSDDQLFIK